MRKLQAASCTLLLLLVAGGSMAMATATEAPMSDQQLTEWFIKHFLAQNGGIDYSTRAQNSRNSETNDRSREAAVGRVRRVADGGANGDLCSPPTRNGMVCCRWASGGGGGCKVKRDVRMRVACAGRPDRADCVRR